MSAVSLHALLKDAVCTSFRMILSDFSKIFNDTKQHADSLQQLSFLYLQLSGTVFILPTSRLMVRWDNLKFGVLCRSSSVLLHTRGVTWCTGKQKSPAVWQNDVWQQLFEQQDITVIWTIHFYRWLPKNHTSAPAPWRHRLKPTRRNMFIRNRWRTSMSWSSIWLKRG